MESELLHLAIEDDRKEFDIAGLIARLMDGCDRAETHKSEFDYGPRIWIYRGRFAWTIITSVSDYSGKVTARITCYMYNQREDRNDYKMGPAHYVIKWSNVELEIGTGRVCHRNDHRYDILNVDFAYAVKKAAHRILNGDRTVQLFDLEREIAGLREEFPVSYLEVLDNIAKQISFNFRESMSPNDHEGHKRHEKILATFEAAKEIQNV